MDRGRSGSAGRWVGAMIALAVVALGGEVAVGQGGVQATRMTSRDVGDLVRALGLSPEDGDAAVALHEAMRASLERAMLEVRRMKRQSDAAILEKLPHAGEARRAWHESLRAFQREAVEKERVFLEDQRAVAGVEESDERWSDAMRLVRRLELRRLAGVGLTRWANVDLRRVMSDLGAARPEIEEVLRGWELEVDRPLVERIGMWEEEAARAGDRDASEAADLAGRDLEIASRVAGLTRASARRIVAALSSEERTAFEYVVRRQVYPLFGDERRGDRALSQAESMLDLTTGQRSRLEARRALYARESARLDAEVVRACDEAEESLMAFQKLPALERLPIEQRGEHPALVLYRRLSAARASLEYETENHVRSVLTAIQREALNVAMK